MSDRPYELVVFGASGFTGRQAAAHLGYRAAALHLRWAIAGRDEGKLAPLAARLPQPPPDVLIADVTDSRSIAELARSAKVVISFLGPYAPLGDELAEQCVDAETHYADVCGENDVIADRVARLHRPARAAGVKLIPACGYESVPFDLAALALDRAFRDFDESRLAAVDAEVRFLFHRNPLRFGHGNSGGTMTTVAGLTKSRNLTDAGAFARAAGARDGRAESRECDLRARRSPYGDWLAPLMPTPFLNPAVIRLTDTRLAEDGDGYANGFTYSEALNTSASFHSKALGAIVAKGSSSLLNRIAAMSRGRRNVGDKALAAALQALAPKAGRGPSQASLDAIDYRIELHAHSSSGLSANGVVTGTGHPGYRSAANILAEAGIALARDDGLPQRAGVLTPATGLGTELLPALRHAGLVFTCNTPHASARASNPDDSGAFDALGPPVREGM